MLFFEIIGWVFAMVLALAAVVVIIYLAVAVAMSFYSLLLMAKAYVKGGKEGLMQHNARMRAKAKV